MWYAVPFTCSSQTCPPSTLSRRSISNGVQKIDTDCAARRETYSTLDDPYDARTTSVQNKHNEDAAPIIAAAYQLIPTLTHPDPYLLNWGVAVRPVFRIEG